MPTRTKETIAFLIHNGCLRGSYHTLCPELCLALKVATPTVTRRLGAVRFARRLKARVEAGGTDEFGVQPSRREVDQCIPAGLKRISPSGLVVPGLQE